MSFLGDRSSEKPMGSHAMMQAFNMGDVPPKVAAEAPTPRSLQIANRTPALLKPPAGGFGKPPPSGFGKPLGIGPPPRLSRGSSRGPVEVKQEWDGVAASTTWDVKGEDLEKVPEDFPLERTHRLIEGVEVKEVAARISEALRVHSIEAEFKTKPPKAKCKTRDFVSFRIRLYAGSENGDPVVVEVQRRKGPASCFMHACRAILNAAEGKKVDAGAPSKVAPFMHRPPSQMKCLQGVPELKKDESEIAQSALNDAMAMLRSNQRDTNILGLENLCALTDPIKTNATVSLLVAKSVALGLQSDDIREEIVVLTERDVFSSGEPEDMTLVGHSELLRQLALTIFANSLALCAKDGCLNSAVSEQSWFREYLVPNLLDEIRRAEANACNATQAAICAHSLAVCSRSLKQFLVDHGFLDALRKANEYGSKCNELLANETERCLEIMCVPVTALE